MENFEPEYIEKRIKGTVTEINYSLLYFEVDNKVRVFVDITNDTPIFPCLDKEVEIIDPILCNEVTAVMGPKTIYVFPPVDDNKGLDNTDLFYLMKQFHCYEKELMLIDHILRKLDGMFFQRLLLPILKVLIENAPFKTTTTLEKNGFKTLEKLEIKCPTDLNYVNSNCDSYGFLNLNTSYYGVHPSKSMEKITDSVTEILIGLLDIDPIDCLLVLKCNKCQVPIKFYNNIGPISNFNKCVIIKKWTVFTEIFEDKSIPPLMYIVTNWSDVIIVDSCYEVIQEKLLYDHDEVCPYRKHNRLVQLVMKSEPVYGYSQKGEFWLEVLFLEDNFKCVLILSFKCMSLVPFLKENAVYKLSYNGNMCKQSISSHAEIYGHKQTKHLYKLEDALFQETQQNLTTPKIYDRLDEINKIVISERTEIISLSTWISNKIITKSNYPSYISERRKDSLYFKPPGTNYQIQLELCDSQRKSVINLFLTHRANFIYPLGLLTDMKVLVRNVQTKGKYLKSTIFSTFEILEYSPKVRFSSANLSFSDKWHWQWTNHSSLNHLGCYKYLPQHSILWGRVVIRSILNLDINSYCNGCRNKSLKGCHHVYDETNFVNMNKWTLKINTRFLVCDSMNSDFKMHTENENFIFAILELSQTKQKLLREAFLKVNTVNFDFFERKPYIGKDQETTEFLEDFYNYIRTSINVGHYQLLDALCLRQHVRNPIPWKMIDFKLV